MKTNYDSIFTEMVNKIKLEDKKPKLLLHACCAPCSSAVLLRIAEFFDITLFFYNPNISPKEEFLFRLSELKRLLSEMNLNNIEIVVPEYDSDKFFAEAQGLEHLKEGEERCKKCYYLRQEKTASYACEHGFNYFCTTLSISPHKNAEWLNEIGKELEDKYNIKYLYSDFKKKEGYKKSCELSNIHNLYRQNYCGCIFSKAKTQKED